MTHLAHLVPHFGTALPRPQLILLRLCTVSVHVCLLSSAGVQIGKIAQGEAEEYYVFALVLFSSEKKNYLLVKITTEREREKCTHTVPDPPITVTCQQYGATHTYILTHTQGCVQYSVQFPWMTAGWISQKSWICSNSLKSFIFFSVWQNKSETQNRNCFFFPPSHTIYLVYQNSFSSEISVRYEMDSGKSVGRGREWNSKRHACTIFSSVQNHAGFPVDYL